MDKLSVSRDSQDSLGCIYTMKVYRLSKKYKKEFKEDRLRMMIL